MIISRLTLKKPTVLYLIFSITLISFNTQGQYAQNDPYTEPPFLQQDMKWVDSVFQTMTPDQRIGQLFMVAAYSNRTKAFEDSISILVKDFHIGGLIFFQGGPMRQAKLTNQYQQEAKIPLMIGIDGEWGLGMRLDSTMRFPFQMSLGAIKDDNLVYQMGAEIARQCKRMGIHVNFAPVVDINNNSENPVINYRSFGEDKYKVTAKSYAYMRGLQDNGVLANAKHFPGHGDTNLDSHLTLPVITHDWARLFSIETYPFRALIQKGLGSVMVAHLNIPTLDATPNHASTLSKPVVTDLLKKQFGFKGLVFTDALNMKGVADYYAPGVVDVKALLAGNDVLLFSQNIPQAIHEIKKAIKSGQITQKEIDIRCKKILAAKQWMGLNQYQPVDLHNLVEDINTPSAQLLHRQLTEASITLVQNKNKLIPLQHLDTLKIATVAIGTNLKTDFQKMLDNYTLVKHYFLPQTSSEKELQTLRKILNQFNLVIVSVHGMNMTPKNNFNLKETSLQFIREMASKPNTIISVFGNSYSLAKIADIEKANSVIVTYQDNQYTQEYAAQLVFGGIGTSGRLPVQVSPHFFLGRGLDIDYNFRFKYTIPEEVGIDSKYLQTKIDSLATVAIKEKATPGCQILIAKEGKVIFNKSYGFHTYDSLKAVENNDIYDIASITKIAASMPALMKLNDEKKFTPDQTIGHYLPNFKKSNKSGLVFRDALAHRGRLQAWIPFWKSSVKKNGKFKWNTFAYKQSKRFPSQVTDSLFVHRNYHRKIYKAIKKSPLKKNPDYIYSDLSFYLYPAIVESLTGKDFESYLKENFYTPLGAYNLTFNAYQQFSKERLVPTEYDSLFRKTLLQGWVNDEGAALLQGISGHAGLFSNANDLAKLMQMHLNMGAYAGKQYISPATIEEFTKCQFCEEGNRRGIGFDKPMLKKSYTGNAAYDASEKSYGHAGFTGTLAWVDPEEELVYIFLSNRVYPTRNNNKLAKLNTRTNIQQVIYEAIKTGKMITEAN
jgi:beta-N-acetylhexosaminidase